MTDRVPSPTGLPPRQHDARRVRARRMHGTSTETSPRVVRDAPKGGENPITPRENPIASPVAAIYMENRIRGDDNVNSLFG